MSDKELSEAEALRRINRLLMEEAKQDANMRAVLLRENNRLNEENAGLLSQIVICKSKIRFLEKAAEK